MAAAQDLPARWDELVASDSPAALQSSAQTCILPIGILEKHGPHAAIGSDLIHVREWAARAIRQEYAVVFPDYFHGQINEARHQPGTFSLPPAVVGPAAGHLRRDRPQRLQADPHRQRARGQSPAPALLHPDPARPAASLRRLPVRSRPRSRARGEGQGPAPVRPRGNQHAGERETSTLLYLRPELEKMDRATQESGENRKRLALPDLYAAIWWYASYPNHYAAEGAKATAELGRVLTEARVAALVRALRTVKADTRSLELQNEYFDRVDKLGR